MRKCKSNTAQTNNGARACTRSHTHALHRKEWGWSINKSYLSCHWPSVGCYFPWLVFPWWALHNLVFWAHNISRFVSSGSTTFYCLVIAVVTHIQFRKKNTNKIAGALGHWRLCKDQKYDLCIIARRRILINHCSLNHFIIQTFWKSFVEWPFSAASVQSKVHPGTFESCWCGRTSASNAFTQLRRCSICWRKSSQKSGCYCSRHLLLGRIQNTWPSLLKEPPGTRNATFCFTFGRPLSLS